MRSTQKLLCKEQLGSPLGLDNHNQSIFELLEATRAGYLRIVKFLLIKNTYDVNYIQRVMDIAVENDHRHIINLVNAIGIVYLTRGKERITAEFAKKFLKNCSGATHVRKLAEHLSICPKCYYVYHNLTVSVCLYCQINLERFVKTIFVDDYLV